MARGGTTVTTATLCTVCGSAADPSLQLAECGECGGRFHLNLRTDVEASGCGAAFVSATCGMTTYCDPCGVRLEAAARASGMAGPIRVA